MAYLGTSLMIGGTAIGAKQTPAYYADVLVGNLYPSCYIRPLGTLVTVPLGHGYQVKVPRWDAGVKYAVANWAAAATSSISGTAEVTGPVSGGILSAAAPVSGTIMTFRGAKAYNDLLVLTNSTDFYEGAYEALGREIAYKIDTHIKGKISASRCMKLKSVDGTIPAGATDVLTGKRVAQIQPLLQYAGVPAFDDDCYVAVGNPLAQYDLFSDVSSTGWISVAQYGDPTRVYRGEVGQMYGVRFLFTPIIKRLYSAAGAASATEGLSTTTTGSNLWVFGAHSFYDLEFQEGGLKIINQDLGSAGAKDATADVGTVGAKVYFGVAPTLSGDFRYFRFAHSTSLKP